MTAIRSSVPEESLGRLPPGVIVEGPLVDAKLRETYVILGVIYAGLIAALVWTITQGIGWVELAVFVGMYSLTTIGIGVGMHRLLVHRSFRCGPVMRAFFCAIATMALQGSVLKWVSNHRRHHLYSDKPGDVHSPYYDGVGNRHDSLVKGMLHAHAGWSFDHVATDAEYYAKDILADPIAMFFVKTRWFWYAMSTILIPGAVGYAVGGIQTMIGCVLFSGIFRSYVMVMATSLVNSVCHSDGHYGYRRFDLNDGTTNELVTTILTFGEGLHNNHHRFPRDAYLSHAWYEIDINGLIIRGLGKLGLVHDIFVRPGRRASTVSTEQTSRAVILNTANSWTSGPGPSAGIEQSLSDLFPE
jgi:stearoyl-CoA desaturase (delta-9 desaturase)